MDDFTVFEFAAEGWPPRLVYTQGQGPAVVLMHELPGMIPECIDLARRIAAGGFTVYLPLLFGQANQPLSLAGMASRTVQLCISQEFYCFAQRRSSPITQWLRALCRRAHQDCGGLGVGVIGMCLTGGFVFSLMADPTVLAPIAAQPSLPFGMTAAHKRALGVDPETLQQAQSRSQAGVPVLALRYSQDTISPPERFDTLRHTFGATPEVIEASPDLCWQRGSGLETLEINSAPGNPQQLSPRAHATLTLGYNDASDHPANRVFQRVLTFLRQQLAR